MPFIRKPTGNGIALVVIKLSDGVCIMEDAVVGRQEVNFIDVRIRIHQKLSLPVGPSIIMSFENNIDGLDTRLADIRCEHSALVCPGDAIGISESVSIYLADGC